MMNYILMQMKNYLQTVDDDISGEHHQQLLSLQECWAPASSLPDFILAWKTISCIAHVTARHCADLTLLHVDNQHIFLQHHAAISVPVSGCKTDQLGHLLFQIHI